MLNFFDLFLSEKPIFEILLDIDKKFKKNHY